MSTSVDILINPVTLRFSYHNNELIYMFASNPKQQLDEMEKLMGVSTKDGPIFDTNVGFLPVATTTLVRGEKNILVDPGNYHIGFYSILKRALASRNLTYDDIDIIATTHTHSDHAASIVHFRNKPWVIGMKEFHDMEAIEGKEIVNAKKSMMGEIIEISDNNETKIMENMYAITTPGHTSGHISFVVKSDEDTGQTIMSGMGELHLEVLTERLLNEFKVKARVGKPQVSYRETILEEVLQIKEVHDKDMPGLGRQFGEVVLSLYPQKRGSGHRFESKVSLAKLKKEHQAAIKEAALGALGSGPILGYPVIDVKVVLEDGRELEGLETPVGFSIAAGKAIREGLEKGKPVLLEPEMKLEVITPDEYLGDVINDLNSRQGEIINISEKHNLKYVDAYVPLSSMFGYSTSLRSLTQGRANFSMEFHSYKEVPAEKVRKMIEKLMGKIDNF